MTRICKRILDSYVQNPGTFVTVSTCTKRLASASLENSPAFQRWENRLAKTLQSLQGRQERHRTNTVLPSPRDFGLLCNRTPALKRWAIIRESHAKQILGRCPRL